MEMGHSPERALSHPQTSWASPSDVPGSVPEQTLKSPEGKVGPNNYSLLYRVHLHSTPEVTHSEG